MKHLISILLLMSILTVSFGSGAGLVVATWCGPLCQYTSSKLATTTTTTTTTVSTTEYTLVTFHVYRHWWLLIIPDGNAVVGVTDHYCITGVFGSCQIILASGSYAAGISDTHGNAAIVPFVATGSTTTVTKTF